MRRAVLALLLAAAIPAAAKDRHGKGGGESFAEPSDAITADDGFARLRATKGVRDAIRATAQDDAEIFAAKPIRIADWLKSGTEPALPAAWQVQQVWMSCDGSYAVTHGAWQQPPTQGWYVTVWHRQKHGDYKWVLDQGGALKTALPQPDMISASLADCPARRGHAPGGNQPPPPVPAKPAVIDYLSGRSDDGTLEWSTTGDGPSRCFTLRMKQDGAMHDVLTAPASTAAG